MSYETIMEGEITITPPLPYRIVKGHGLLPENVNRTKYASVVLVVNKRIVDTDEGILTVIEVTGVQGLGTCGSYADDNLKDILALATLSGIDHEFEGYIEGHGEDFGDIWRVAVVDGEVKKVMAVVTWPDGLNH